MKFTIYIMFSNLRIVKKEHIDIKQVRDILEILKTGQISFKYCVRKESRGKVVIPVKRVSMEQLKNENLIFKII